MALGAPLRDKYYDDFSGGLRLDKSDYKKNSNEVPVILNYVIRHTGQLEKRLGSHQFGTTLTNNVAVDNTFYWGRFASGALTGFQLVNNRAASGSCVFKIVGSYLTAPITTASTTISLDSATGFASSGTVEIDGDIITYAAVSTNDLTGVTGITSSHATNTAVHQTVALTGDQVAGTRGIYYAVLNDLLFVQGNNGASTFDGSTLTAVADGDEPNAIFAVTYRQRIFCVGVGGTQNTVYFSDSGDSTAWTATNNFKVEDTRGGEITGLFVSPSDELLIFKPSSTFAYDEVSLRERSRNVGAYNHRVPKVIDGIIYTFCPAGVFATNGVSFRKISEPVQEILEYFAPQFDIVKTTIINTHAAVWDQMYILHLGGVTAAALDPSLTSGDIFLVYDTVLKSWSVWALPVGASFQCLQDNTPFGYGRMAELQPFQGLFGGDSNGKLYRFFSGKWNLGGTLGGVNTFKDLVSDTGTAVQATLFTRLDDLGNLFLKHPNYVRVFTEDFGSSVAIRYEDENGLLSNWVPLGEVRMYNQFFRVPAEVSGFRFQISISHTEGNSAPVLNGVGYEEIDVTTSEALYGKDTSA
jgi:hypothetical protein